MPPAVTRPQGRARPPAGTGVLKKRKPDRPGRGAATAKDCGGSKDIGNTAPILLPPAVVPPAWPRPVARGMTVSRIRVLVARPARALT